MNAQLNIDITVQTRKRLVEEPFRPTRTDSYDFHWVTDLEHYLPLLTTIGNNVFADVVSRREPYAESTVHVSIRMENVTHPEPAAGVVPLPKGHFDAALSDEEVVSAKVVSDLLSTLIGNLKNTAKY